MPTNIFLFTLGIVLFQQLPVLPDSGWFWPGLAIAAAALYYRRWRLLAFLAGLFWALVFATVGLGRQLPVQLQGRDIRIEGVIVGLPQSVAQRVRFDFAVAHWSHPVDHGLPEKIRLSWYYPDAVIEPGQHWRFTVRLKRPHGNSNPGGFDYERWLFVKGIGATGYVRKQPAPELLATPAALNISRWRQDIAERISAMLPDSDYLGVIEALVIGVRQDIEPEQWDIFRRTGTVHLIAISGLHIGLVSGLIYFLLLKLTAWTAILRIAPPKAAAIAAVVAGLFYAALAGFAVPTQRALIMLAIVMASIYWQRNAHPLHVLSCALLVILLLDPLAVLSPGFWLSFLAVAVILYALAGRLGGSGYWAGLWQVNWVTCIGLAPVLLLFFQQVSVIAPLANLVAIPLISLFIIPVLLLAVLMVFLVPPLGQWLLQLVDYSLHGLMTALSRLADLAFATLQPGQPAIWSVLMALTGSLLLLAPRGVPGRWLGVVLFMPLLFADSQRPAVGAVAMTLLDVGQGLSVVVRTASHVLVFDAGAKYSERFDMGASVVLPFLRARKIRRVDALIVSHGDNDHIGGVASLRQAMPVESIYSSVPQLLGDGMVQHCRAGQSWQWDAVVSTMLSPGEQVFTGENDNSCVLRIVSRSGKILLTGDIEAPAEAWLVQRYGERLQAALLVAAHHGSNTSSSASFLQAVRPEIILIPAGYRNRFGFPAAQVLQRYSDIHARWLTSAEAGALTVVMDGKVSVQSYREQHRRYWQQ